MTQRQTNALNMFNATLQYLDNHAAVWNGEPMIVEAVDAIRDEVDSIKADSKDQAEAQSNGYTTAKSVAVNHAISLAWTIAKRLKLYARKTSNFVLLEQVNIPFSEMDDGDTQEIVDRLLIIANGATAHIAALPTYKILPADVTALNAAIDFVKPKEGERDAIIAEHVKSTESLGSRIHKVKDMLEDLDDHIDGLIDDEDFKVGYHAARRINDRRGHGPLTPPPVVPTPPTP